MSRIYVCHTFYHVYVSILKEMKLEREDTVYEKGDIALSSISTDFGDLEERLRKTGIFRQVMALDEKREEWRHYPVQGIQLQDSLPSIVRITAIFSNIW